MTTHRVLVTTAWLRPGDHVDQMLREAGFEVVHSSFKDREPTGEPLIDVVRGFHGIVAGTDAFTPEVIAAARELRVLGRTGVGYDNIDVAAATEHDVAVCFTPAVNRRSVAEHVLALMLNCARLIPQNVRSVRAGGWDQVSGRELAGAKLGIVGLGSIGKLVARLAIALGMEVLAFDARLDGEFAREHGIREVTLDDLLRESDFVSLHLFLDGSTYHLIDDRALALMKPSAYLINTARGGVVDEEALADAIERGAIAGAALDVTEVEPLPAGSRLREFGNVIVTAHIGAATTESRARSGAMAARAVIDVLNGRPPEYVVNPEYATLTPTK
ncbi:phosphoglycerate dehydrogenase [Nonomuraea sp. K274]|uniref:Phosphoglycerate dehydrogenase n=1 Tax=Nonomuraea cypriaca TaxID=1187855 RepID=A0A931F1A1_9ACTN|nr:phosphoglycerate dehydrogenase [Nonomuraea cypriaca]MBF8189397.1 phosphoglycerate dehydrogenase [Nonomuraea cypriaca]